MTIAIPGFDAVIFDWAGTTVDYGCFAPVRALLEAFSDCGVEATVEEARQPMGLLKHDHIEAMLHMERIADAWAATHGGAAPTAASVDEVYHRFEPQLIDMLPRYATPKPGVIDAVAELRGAGLKIGSTTGYTDTMMAIVAPQAASEGYRPDFMITPDGVDGHGRPAPYMIFANMRALGLTDVRRVAKVGDTVSDIMEGKHAGCYTIGVTEGSSLMGLGLAEFKALDEAGKAAARRRTRDTFVQAGADAVIDTMADLPALLAHLA